MRQSDKKVVKEVDAKAGRKVKGMPFVLGISTATAVVLIFIIYALFVR